MKKILIALPALLLLTSCSSVLPKGAAPTSLYTLNPPQIEQSETALPYNLQIRLPQVAPGLDTERIALRKTDNQIDYYTDTKWAGSLNTLVQSLLVEGFDGTHRFKSVNNDLVDMNVDYSLMVEIRDFQVEYQGHAPQIHVRMVAKVINAQTNSIVHTYGYTETKNAEADTMAEIMKAFDAAYQTVATQMVDDVTTALKSKAPSKRK